MPDTDKPTLDVLPDPPEGCGWGRVVRQEHAPHGLDRVLLVRFIRTPGMDFVEPLDGEAKPGAKWSIVRCCTCREEAASADGRAPRRWLRVDAAGAALFACSESCAFEGVGRTLSGSIPCGSKPQCCASAAGGRVQRVVEIEPTRRVFWGLLCPHCADPTIGQVSFCPYCGAKLPEAKP